MKRTLVILALGAACTVAIIGLWPDPPVKVPRVVQVHPRARLALDTAADNVHQSPRSSDAWGEYGMTLFAHQFRDEALYCFERAGQLDQREFRWHYLAGYLRESVDLDAAHSDFQEALSRQPDYLPARIRLVHVLHRLGRLDDAELQLEVASQLAPADPHVLLERGRFARIRGDLAAARMHLEAAAATPGWYPRAACTELTQVYARSGDGQAALAAQQAAARLPEDALSAGMPDRVLLEAQTHNALSRSLAHQADLYMASGEWDLAIPAFEQLHRSRPDFPLARLNLARCLAMQGNIQRAITLCREVCREFPADADARLALAMTLEKAGNEEGAILAYRDAVQVKPDFTTAHFNLGLILERRGDVDGACVAYRAAADADPRNAPAHLALGVLLQKSGRPKHEYLPHLEAAVQLVPGDPVPRSFLDKARDSESP